MMQRSFTPLRSVQDDIGKGYSVPIGISECCNSQETGFPVDASCKDMINFSHSK